MTEEFPRQLDMMVAEHIMGWVFVNGFDGSSYTMLKSLEAAKEWVAEFPDTTITNEPPCPRVNVIPSMLPQYSTDIAAAWTVMEFMRSKLFSVRQRFTEFLRVECSTVLPSGDFVAHSQVPLLMTPEHICYAALRTTGHFPQK